MSIPILFYGSPTLIVLNSATYIAGAKMRWIIGGYPLALSDGNKGPDVDGDLLEQESSMGILTDSEEAGNVLIEPGGVSIEVEEDGKDDPKEVSVEDCSNILGGLSSEIGNLSIASGRTISVPGAHGRLPDFAIVQLHSKVSTRPRYDGYEATEIYPRMLCETKSCSMIYPKEHSGKTSKGSFMKLRVSYTSRLLLHFSRTLIWIQFVHGCCRSILEPRCSDAN